MLFTTPLFVGFLALAFLLYYIVPKKAQWLLLLGLSLVYYASAGLWSFCYVGFTVITTWLVGLKISHLQARQTAWVAEHRSELTREERKAYNAKQKRVQRRWLVLGMALNFGLLAATKVLAVPRFELDILVPLGISFYTFRIMGYLIDVFWDKIPAQKNPAKLALFAIFFPQVLQGPISRWDYLSESLFAPHKFDWALFSAGAQRIIWGYFKKLLIADRLAIAIGALKGESGLPALLTMLLYAAQLFCDFTGGMDIAIGVGQCFGVRMEENFVAPFRSKNIFEYWRRWHITMGTWFRDYVFYPISIAKPLQKITAKIKQRRGPKAARRVPVYLATIVTWFVTGVWHGLAWNFIVWGLLNGVVILISQELLPVYEKFHKRFPKMQGRAYDAFQVARTFLLMALIRAFDIYLDVPRTFALFGSIVLYPQAAKLSQSFAVLPWHDWLAAGLGLALVIASSYLKPKVPKAVKAAFWLALVLAILVFGVYGLGFDASSFIYTRF